MGYKLYIEVGAPGRKRRQQGQVRYEYREVGRDSVLPLVSITMLRYDYNGLYSDNVSLCIDRTNTCTGRLLPSCLRSQRAWLGTCNVTGQNFKLSWVFYFLSKICERNSH